MAASRGWKEKVGFLFVKIWASWSTCGSTQLYKWTNLSQLKWLVLCFIYFTALEILLKRKRRGLERQLNRKDCLVSLQRARIWFPTPTSSGSQPTTCNLGARGFHTLFSPPRAPYSDRRREGERMKDKRKEGREGGRWRPNSYPGGNYNLVEGLTWELRNQHRTPCSCWKGGARRRPSGQGSIDFYPNAKLTTILFVP